MTKTMIDEDNDYFHFEKWSTTMNINIHLVWVTPRMTIVTMAVDNSDNYNKTDKG